MAPSPQTLNPRTKSYEFLGPLGALLITLGVPGTLYGLYFAWNEHGCPPQLDKLLPNFIQAVSSTQWWLSLYDPIAMRIYLAWYTYCVVAWFVLPGEWVEGTVMRNGLRKKYIINAFSTFVLALSIVTAIIYRGGPQSLTFLYERWVGFVTAGLLVTFAQALGCYLASFRPGALLALGGNSGNPIYDAILYWKRAVGSFDLKSFTELRPGLMLWALVDISMACEQYVRRGGNITDSMCLVVLFHTWYTVDSLYNERAVFTTMNITSDGLGFMLSVAVPIEAFIYSLQARYLVFKQVRLLTNYR